jgi:hypothetical protein
MARWTLAEWALAAGALATGILLVIAIGYTSLEALEELAEHLLGWPEGASSGVPTKCHGLPVQLPGVLMTPPRRARQFTS